MEPWQSTHITMNEDLLAACTICDPILLAKLSAYLILSDDDICELEATLNSAGHLAQTTLLFKIVKSRKNSFEAVAKALLETDQKESLEILKQAYCKNSKPMPDFARMCIRHYDVSPETTWADLSETLKSDLDKKPVLFQGEKIDLRLINKFYNINNLAGIDIIELARSKIPSIVDNQLSDELAYYIPRRLKPRNRLDKNVFQNVSRDVFAFQDVDQHQIISLIGAYETDYSGNQLETQTSLTVRLILLECENHFDKICQLSPVPVHWVKCKKDGTCELVKSSGSVKNLQKYVSLKQECISEDQFAKLQHQVIVISDTPGMGKTILACNIARKVSELHPTQIVRFLVMIELVRALGNQEVNVDSIIKSISQQSSTFNFGRKLVEHILKTEPCTLIFDGIDEVLSRDLGTALHILNIVTKELKLATVVVTTRPHLLELVENELGVFGNTIEPFGQENQMEFLLKFWQSEGLHINESVNQFASLCLNALKGKVPDVEQNIAGIPLQCRLLAEVYKENANRCSIVGYENYQHSIPIISSLFDMYERHFHMRFSQITTVQPFFQKMLAFMQTSSDAVKQAHIYHSLELLFPDQVEQLLTNRPHIPIRVLCGYGIMEKNASGRVRFIHRTFAEYLIAWFAVEMELTEPFVPFLLDKLLATKPVSEILYTPFGVSIPIPSSNFEFPVLTYFISEFVKRFPNSRLKFSTISDLIDSKKFEKVCPIFLASAASDYTHVPLAVTLAVGPLSAAQSTSNMSELLLITSKYSGELLMKTFCSQRDISYVKTHSKTGSYEITPLHVAIQRGHYNLVEYLTIKYKNNFSRLPYLLHFCVFESLNENISVLEDKKQIIKLFMKKSRRLADESLADNTTPLLQPNVHAELVECLIEQGANVNLCDNKGDTILHKLTENLISPQQYHRLVLLLSEKKFMHFNIANGTHRTPLHSAVERVELLHETLQFFQSVGVNFNAVDDSGIDPYGNKTGDSILFYAIRGRRSENFLRLLIELGADPSHVNQNDEEDCGNVLHMCCRHGDYESVKYFVNEHGMDVNVRTSWNQLTPLHLAAMKRTDSNVKIQRFLIHAGADVNATNYDFDHERRNPFLQALTRGQGISLEIIHLMEEHGLVITSEIASRGIAALLLNRNILSGDLDNEFAQVIEVMIQKGGHFNIKQNPWNLEHVVRSMPNIIQSTRVTATLLSQAQTCGLLNQMDAQEIEHISTNSQKSEYFYRIARTKPGSWERVCMILVASNQLHPFVYLRQCLRGRLSFFVTPTPGLIPFLYSEQARVIIVSTKNAELSVTRIQDFVEQQSTVLEEYQLTSTLLNSESLILLKCFSVSSSLVTTIAEGKAKVICLTSFISEDFEDCPVIADTFTWEDISKEFFNRKTILFGWRKFKVNELFSSHDILHIPVENFMHHWTTCTIVDYKVGHALDSESCYLSTDIFHYFLQDKLVFSGIGMEELKRTAKFGQTVQSFGPNSNLENVDYLVLNGGENQFENLCLNACFNLHWIRHEFGCFKLLKTCGSSTQLKPFLKSKRLCNNLPNCNCEPNTGNTFACFTLRVEYFEQEIKTLKYEANFGDLSPKMLHLLELARQPVKFELPSVICNESIDFTQLSSTCFESIQLVISTRWFTNKYRITKFSSDTIISYVYPNKYFQQLDSIVERCSQTKSSLTDYLKDNINAEFISKWVHVCLHGNFFNLLKIVLGLSPTENLLEFQDLLVIAVNFAEIPVLELLLNVYQETGKNLHDFRLTLRDFHKQDLYTISLLHIGALRGSHLIVEHLLTTWHFKSILDHATMRDILHHCISGLHTSEDGDRNQVVELLIKANPALTEEKNRFTQSPLMMPNTSVDLITCLMKQGVNVDEVDEKCKGNFLHFCAQYMSLDEFEDLVENLFSTGDLRLFHSQDKDKCLPLHYAVKHFEVSMSTLACFTAAKVNVNAADVRGNTVIIWAVQHRRSMNLLHDLVSLGADVRKGGFRNRTPLHFAADRDNLTALRYLLSLDCDVNAEDSQNDTPLHLVLRDEFGNNIELVKALIECGADVNAIGRDHDTPLVIAMRRCKRGKFSNRVVELLKNSGAR